MHRELFLGPFDDADAVAKTMSELDQNKPYWDYDGFMICYGKDPLPDNYVNGLELVSEDTRELIEIKRKDSLLDSLTNCNE